MSAGISIYETVWRVISVCLILKLWNLCFCEYGCAVVYDFVMEKRDNMELEKFTTEVLTVFRQAYGDWPVGRTQWLEWNGCFNSGRNIVDDDERSGRFTTLVTPGNMALCFKNLSYNSIPSVESSAVTFWKRWRSANTTESVEHEEIASSLSSTHPWISQYKRHIFFFSSTLLAEFWKRIWISKDTVLTLLSKSRTNRRRSAICFREKTFRLDHKNSRHTGTSALLCKMTISKEVLLRTELNTIFF